MSVPSPSEAQATLAATLVDEWVQLGVVDAVVCPGSRSTPMALAIAARQELRVHVRIDERSAGFFAIGRSLATGRPTIVTVTSGTAAAELHAAVAEADQAHVALVVVTADRPPELHGVGAPQTIEQQHLYGEMVRWFVDPGVARWEARDTWRDLAGELYEHAAGQVAGPVHLNLAFVEPLVAPPRELPEARKVTPHLSSRQRPQSSAKGIDAARVLVVAGSGTDQEVLERYASWGWVVIGDATRTQVTPYADPILRSDETALALRPDLVVRAGGLCASKVLAQRLREWGAPVVGVSPYGAIPDPDRVIVERVAEVSSTGSVDGEYSQRWREAAAVVEAILAPRDQAPVALDEPAVARAVVRACERNGAELVVGSSMPFRDVEWWSAPRRTRTHANRGVNGIDGVLSTAFGVAVETRCVALVGDVTFLHDAGSLADGVGELGGSCVIVVVDNHGGGIFSFLPQAEVLEAAPFERLFTTPRHRDAAAIAEAYGHRGARARTVGELERLVDDALEHSGVSVIVADVPGVLDNVHVHDALNTSVIAALDDALT